MDGPRCNQFSKPTEPKLAHDLTGKPYCPENFLLKEYQNRDTLQLPEPPRVVSSYKKDFEFQLPERATPSQSYGGRTSLSPSTGKTPKGEREVVDELAVILVECMEEVNTRSKELLLRKFFSEMEHEERLERFVVERLRQSKVKAIHELCDKLTQSMQGRIDSAGVDVAEAKKDEECSDVSSRGLIESVEELSLTLERFKLKTPDLKDDIEKENQK